MSNNDPLFLERRRRKQASYRKREEERQAYRKRAEEERQKRLAEEIPDHGCGEKNGPHSPYHERQCHSTKDKRPTGRDHPIDKMEGPISFVGGYKASPSSSISMSQSPGTWSLHKKPGSTNIGRERAAVPASKKNIFGSNPEPSTKRRRLRQRDSDSSDDDDEDFLHVCFSPDTPPTQANQTELKPISKDSPDGEPKAKTIWEELGSSSESEGGVLMKKQKVLTEKSGEHKIALNATFEKDNRNEEPANLGTGNAVQSPPKVIRNPLVAERAQREETAAMLPTAPTSNAESLWNWDDSDSDDNDGGAKNAAEEMSQNDLQLLEDNEQNLREKWYPSFDCPKFGPAVPPQPLVLNEVYQVPASISRYLAKYQLEGIKFMFEKAIANRRGGCILGDDMGLGKTVQTVSLIAALLEKTGTEYDRLVVSRRRAQADKRSRQLQVEKEKSLMAGCPYTKTASYEDVTKELGLPAMAPIMVVAPKNVVTVWEGDLATWGHFSTVTYDGNKKRRELALEAVETGKAEVMIVAYPTFQDKDKFAALNMGQVNWKMIIIDELHVCKNVKAEVAISLRTFRDKYKCVVVGLTGTIMPNVSICHIYRIVANACLQDHKELWNLVDLVAPNYLGSRKDFMVKFANPIKLSRQRKAHNSAVTFGQQQKQELDKLLNRELLLRRDKKDVLADKLPQKIESVVFCELSDIQRRVYKHILALPDFDILIKSNAPCDCGVNKKIFLMYQQLGSKREKLHFIRKHRENITTRGECCYRIPENAVLWEKQHLHGEACKMCPKCLTLPALSRMSKVSSHVALLQAKENPEFCIKGSTTRVRAEVELEVAKALLPLDVIDLIPGKYIRENSILNNHSDLSGKFRYLGFILDRILGQNEKVLIFSNFTSPLDLIENFLESKGYSSLRIDGSTPSSRREEIKADFREKTTAFILLLSKKAMGVGVTLTTANNVIMFDVDWNPAVDSQAQDRSYRIGQDRTVNVYRLVARGTVEEMMYLRQLYKQDLTNRTLDEGVGANVQPGHFRGVHADKFRKGELFGLENLLKFKDGTFMNYKRNDGQSKAQGEILETMKARNVDGGVLPFDCDSAILAGFEDEMNVRSADDVDSDDDDDDAHVGGQSQAAMKLLEEADPIKNFGDEDDLKDRSGCLEQPTNCGSMPYGCLSSSASQYAVLLGQSTESLPISLSQLQVPMTVGSNNYAQQTTAKPTLSSKNLTSPVEPTPDDGIMSVPVVSGMERALPNNCKNPTTLTTSKASKTTIKIQDADEKRCNNTTLVGSTTAALRRGERGKTAFTRRDLPLPGKTKRKI